MTCIIIDLMESDGCFPEASGILTDEEYFSKVGFSADLLSIFNLYEKDGIYYWDINAKQGYIQKGRFRPENPEKEVRLEWAIVYDRDTNAPGIIFVNYGDLLVHLPVADRRRWKKYLREIRSPVEYAETLLFFENEEESNNVVEYWNKRGEDSDLPWFTPQQKEQIAKELRYLKKYDRENDEYLDLRWLEFRREVLDKYINNELCQVRDGFITFLRQDKRTSASTVNFRIKDDNDIILMVRADDHIFVPPQERRHWHQYEIIKGIREN
jgi:hypothetical protein